MKYIKLFKENSDDVMKHSKFFEEDEKLTYKVGDYVKIIDKDVIEWIKAGIYGNIIASINSIFRITGVDESEHYFLISIDGNEIDWFDVNQLEAPSDLEITILKYNV